MSAFPSLVGAKRTLTSDRQTIAIYEYTPPRRTRDWAARNAPPISRGYRRRLGQPRKPVSAPLTRGHGAFHALPTLPLPGLNRPTLGYSSVEPASPNRPRWRARISTAFAKRPGSSGGPG